eukprot:CAMPEP_0171479992 /NCGR_PEP_ID=MMETSP0946-20130122/5783_1 /TAXON_ID=109269 /ORGANISM="Vaucheria litorea, Strain CCMP2940" /LENGTH=494 /DNA_ID=CAMNT_0012011085 /DNA_START=121 /DNA_END=1605 /DNA_ORIENTATION=+
MDAFESFDSYLNIPNENILKAVEKSGKRALAQDISAMAGVDLNQSKKNLQILASLTGGNLEVTNDGEIVYNFPENFRSILRNKSTAFKLQENFKKIWPLLFYCIRISFGVFLIISLVIVFTGISVITSTSDREDDRRNGRSGGFSGGISPFSFGISPLDFFYYRPYYGYYSTPIEERQSVKKMGFFESVFSYIFGDGDPNTNIEKEKISKVADVIRKNGGAVIAEQIAPYLNPPSLSDSDSVVVDESFVLPAVTALNGVPQVTDDGDIIYVFPDLKTTANDSLGINGKSTKEIKYLLESSGISAKGLFEKDEMIRALKENLKRTQSASNVGTATPIVEEKEIEFSIADTGYKFLAGGLGILNLGGALYLRTLLQNAAVKGLQLGSYGIALNGIFPLLLTYGVAYNAIPLFRYFRNKIQNRKIEERNRARLSWLKLLRSGNVNVERKLRAAGKLAVDLTVVKEGDIAYSTAKDLAEQGSDPFKDEFDDFNKRLSK